MRAWSVATVVVVAALVIADANLIAWILAVGALGVGFIVAVAQLGSATSASVMDERDDVATATMDWRSAIKKMLAERNIENPPDPEDPGMTNAQAAEIVEALHDIPTRTGYFKRGRNNDLNRWLYGLPIRDRIAWIMGLNQRRGYEMQRNDVYDEVMADYKPGTIREQQKAIRDVFNQMLDEKLVQTLRIDGTVRYELTEEGEKLVLPTPDADRVHRLPDIHIGGARNVTKAAPIRPAVDNPALDWQRRKIAHLLEERSIANPPDPRSPHLTKEDANALIDQLLAIPEANGDFDRDLDNELTRWWKTLSTEARIAWYLDKNRDGAFVQRQVIYDAVRDGNTPGKVRDENKRIAQVLNRMIEAGQVRQVTEDGETNYRLTTAGEKVIPPRADHLRVA